MLTLRPALLEFVQRSLRGHAAHVFFGKLHLEGFVEDLVAVLAQEDEELRALDEAHDLSLPGGGFGGWTPNLWRHGFSPPFLAITWRAANHPRTSPSTTTLPAL
jgi:hypothetical protein